MMSLCMRRPCGWARLTMVMAVLTLALAACGGDSEVLQFPGPTPTPSVAPQLDE